MSQKKQKRAPVPKALLKFIREKLSTATTDMSIAQQATAWFADQKKVDDGELFGGRSVASFISLVYRLRTAKGRKRKVKRARKATAAVPAKPKPAPTPTKSDMTLRKVIEAYEAYLVIAPHLRLADEFLKQQGLKVIVVANTVTLQKL